MKFSSKLLIAITITLILSFVGITVWAAPSRQGTVLNPPHTKPISPKPVTQLIPVTGSTYNVEMLCGCSEEGLITRITDPEKDISQAPEGFTYLSDALKVELKGACDFEVCYPYPKNYEDQKGQIYKWDSVFEEWDLADSTIYGDPRQICTVDKTSTENIYALISSNKINSFESLSKVTLCGCSSDDSITSILEPETNVSAAPAGLAILTDATKVKCKEACDVEVCFPYTDDYKLKIGQIYKWDENINTWSLTKSTINGDPERICTLDEGSIGGVFTLIGK